MPSIQQEANELINDLQLSDHAAMKIINEKNSEIAARRRDYALAREKRRKDELEKLPKQVEARDSSLISNRIKHRSQDMLIKLPLDNDLIKTLAFNNYEHLGNAFYALSSILPVRSGRAKVNKLLDEIDAKFKTEVVDAIIKQQQYGIKKLKQYAQIQNIDEIICRSEKPIIFEFRSRTPSCSKWLNWCAQADSTAVLYLKLAHLGLITEREYFDRVSTLVSILDSFAKFIYKARTTAFKALKVETSNNTEAKKDFDNVVAELKTSQNIELDEDGNIKDLDTAQSSSNSTDAKIAS